MNYRHKVSILATMLIMLLHCPSGYCAAAYERDSISAFAFQFRFQNSLVIYDYKNNAEEFDRLKKMIENSNTIEIDKIDISGFASPDGYDISNRNLANDRAIAIRGYLCWKYPQLKKVPITITSHIGNWDKVIKTVENDPNVPNKGEVLSILRSKSDNPTKTADLIAVPDGAYSYVLKNILSQQREVVTCMFHYKTATPIETPDSAMAAAIVIPAEVAAVIPAEPSVDEVVPATEVQSVAMEPVIPKEKKALLAVKTDLVQWMGMTPDFDGLHAVTPNLAVEVFFAKRWSVEAGYSYSNWNAFTKGNGLWAVSEGWIEPRFWLKNNGSFNGLYFGVYGQGGSYDIQKSVVGHTGKYYGGGVSVGYAQPLSKHWFLELGIRGGYRGTADGVLYDIEQDKCYYNRAEDKSKFVPQVKLNISYRIGRNSK